MAATPYCFGERVSVSDRFGYYSAVNLTTAQKLLREYCEHRSEEAFAELIRLHVDFVYSTALRLLGNNHDAEDVTQSVFIALAQDAARLRDHPTLYGWLHRTARNLAANVIRSNTRRRVREQAATDMTHPISSDDEAGWPQIAGCLDDCLDELGETDRDVLILRYFERKTARQVGDALSIGEEAAQKRASRALERLRIALAARGATAGVAALTACLGANAVHAAPSTISTGLASAVLVEKVASGVLVSTTTKAIVMTTLQKTVIASALVLTAATGVFEGYNAAVLRTERNKLLQEQSRLAGQVQQLTESQAVAALRIALLTAENERLNGASKKLAKLRAETAQLKALSRQMPEAKDPTLAAAEAMVSRTQLLKSQMEASPEAMIPEIQLLTAEDWADAAKGDLETEDDFHKAFSLLRDHGIRRFLSSMSRALVGYSGAHNGELPNALSELVPYFETPPAAAMLDRYQIVTGSVLPLTRAGSKPWNITLREVVDSEHDALFQVGSDGSVGAASFRDTDALSTLAPAIQELMKNARENGEDYVGFSPEQLLPYLHTEEEKEAYLKLRVSKPSEPLR